MIRILARLTPLTLLVGAALPAGALELVRAPYLQRTGPDQVTVVFRTDDPCEGAVLWGPDREDLTESPAPGQTDHVAELTGLTPDTTYAYEIRCDGLRIDPDAIDPTFTTAPPVGSREPFRAWILGDSGTGNFNQLRARDAAWAHWGADRPDLFLHMGDMAYGDGTDAQFTFFFYRVYADLLRHVPVFPTMGNHEGNTSSPLLGTGAYYEGYVLPTDGRLGGVPSGTEGYYSYDWGNVHFIVLESHQNDRSPDGPMLTWLAQDLASTTQDWVVAYWHHPPYTKGSHDSDTETSHIEMRENAVPILEAGGVDLVLGGHSHIYERSYLLDGAYETPSTDQGIVDASDGRPTGDGPYLLEPGLTPRDGALYVVAGHGGASVDKEGDHPLLFFAEPEYGSVLLDVRGDRMTLRNVRDDGEVTDTVTLLKGPGLDVASPDGGDSLVAGTSATVTWGSRELTGEATLSFSCDDGVSWLPVGTADVAAGSFEWTPPDIGTADGRLRIAVGSVDDVSDARFSVEGADPCPAPPADESPPVDPDGEGCACDGEGAAFLPLLLPLALLAPRRRRRDP